ncbi:MAG TPA: DNA-binding response regulator, partial [Roseburia sp.]|nr:DNA-binding response regulator [Roseburia sp.]
MRLLIVEDEKQICDMVAKSLYDVGYEVDTCYDGEEALECILSEEYDLIVLDLNLPG